MEYTNLLSTIYEIRLLSGTIACFIDNSEATPTSDAWIQERLEILADKVAIAQKEID
jgi:hypothetical protein